jgi:hypothetical protein
VLGFIDKFSQSYNCRFLLILNSDKLVDHTLWNDLREKVIDQELQLKTSPDEAFAIARQLAECEYTAAVEAPIRTCCVTNIRIVKKVIQAVDLIVGKRTGLDDNVLARIIPSTVLLGAIHFKGIADGPDFEFVLSFGSQDNFLDQLQNPDPSSSDDDKTAKWSLLLTQLGIVSCDNYEQVVVDFLESGLVDASELDRIINRYIAESDRSEATVEFNNFIRRVVWDHKAPDVQLLADAKVLTAKADLVDAHIISKFADELSRIEGGASMANSAIKSWVDAFRAANPDGISAHDSTMLGGLHPDIKAALGELSRQSKERPSVLEACLKIARDSGWGTREEMALKSATVEDFERAIRTCDVQDLQTFMYQMLRFVGQEENYKSHFGNAATNFVQASINICNDPSVQRLAKLIRILFKDANLSSKLELGGGALSGSIRHRPLTGFGWEGRSSALGQEVIWGADLQRAIDEAGARAGDDIALTSPGKRAVTVKVKDRDDQVKVIGEREITAHRNGWDVRRLETLREEARGRVVTLAEHAPQSLRTFDHEAPRAQPRHKINKLLATVDKDRSRQITAEITDL